MEWQPVLIKSVDINIYWANFMHFMNAAVELFVPLKQAAFLSKNTYDDTHILSGSCTEKDIWHGRLTEDLKYKLYEKFTKIDCKCKQAINKLETDKDQRLVDSGSIDRR